MEVAISSKIKTLIKLAIGIGALVVISKSGHLNWPLLGELFSQPETLFVLLALAGINLYLQAVRWWIIVRKTFPGIGLARITKIQFIGSFFNFVFPSSIGGDVLRGYYVAQEQTSRLRAVLTVILDRFVGLYSLIFLSALFLCVSPGGPGDESMRSLSISVWALFFGCTLFLILIASNQLIKVIGWFHFFQPSQFLLKAHDQLRAFVLDYKMFGITFLIGVFSQVIAVVFFHWIAGHTDLTNATFIQLLSVVPLGFLAMSIPISPAGVGVGQVAYLFLIQQIVGETNDFGPTAISAFQLALLFWSLLGGWYYLTMKKPANMEEKVHG